MVDPTPAPTPAPTPTPAPAPTPPWYEGKVDADMLGHWDNKGWKRDDPASIAIEATKAARAAQQFVGLPAEQLLRLPKDASDEAGWNAVYQRLGAPADPKEYDFSAIKNAAGQPPDAALLDTIRATATALRLPKDKAPDLAAAVVKHLDGVQAEQKAVVTAKYATEKAALDKSWSANPELNMLHAKQGAKRLGLDPEAVAALEGTVGYQKTMEALRKVGALGAEDPFHEGGSGGDSSLTTVEGAQARLKELTADKAWGKRLNDRDPAAVREFQSLTQLIAAAA